MRITGIGGYFLRASDPDSMATWYRDALGVPFAADGNYAVFHDEAPGSVAVFSLFGPDDGYLGEPSRQSAMVNLRVDNLDEVLAHLAAIGAHTEPVLDEENGRFSWTVDPEGNRIELWEPPRS
jgi:predicted enzyme related to lactoylglutathione lyase